MFWETPLGEAAGGGGGAGEKGRGVTLVPLGREHGSAGAGLPSEGSHPLGALLYPWSRHGSLPFHIHLSALPGARDRPPPQHKATTGVGPHPGSASGAERGSTAAATVRSGRAFQLCPNAGLVSLALQRRELIPSNAKANAPIGKIRGTDETQQR